MGFEISERGDNHFDGAYGQHLGGALDEIYQTRLEMHSQFAPLAAGYRTAPAGAGQASTTQDQAETGGQSSAQGPFLVADGRAGQLPDDQNPYVNRDLLHPDANPGGDVARFTRRPGHGLWKTIEPFNDPGKMLHDAKESVGKRLRLPQNQFRPAGLGRHAGHRQ